MTEKHLKSVEQWMDERFELALRAEETLGNKDGRQLLPQNADYNYYKGICDALVALGFDWIRNENGKHRIIKK